jgi:nitrite reductase/ring-hydroxylating ferredoxin subunit
MPEFIKAAKTSEIQPGSGKVVSVNGKDLALFNLNGTFYCIDNACVHRGGPLGDGFIQESTVVCPWHGWQYEITSGQCKTNPPAKLACYQVKVEGDDVLVSA